MKKVFFIAVGIFLVFNLNAQKIGVKAGGGLFTVVSVPDNDYAYMTGYNASVFFQKSIIPMLSLRPGLSYIQKGLNGTVLNLDYSQRTNYLQMDLNLRLKPLLIPLYVVAGAYGAYALSGETKIGSISQKTVFDKDHTSPMDYGLQAFLGYQQNLIFGKLFFEFGYMYGLYDYDNSSLTESYNRGFTVGAGLVFGL